jgi:hypothetical protein
MISAKSWGASPRLKGVARGGCGTPCVPSQLTGNCQHTAVNNKGGHKGGHKGEHKGEHSITGLPLATMKE